MIAPESWREAAGGGLVVDGLHVGYAGQNPTVKGIGFSVAPGETVALVGESGCGKTTTVRALLGLLPRGATATGRVDIAGSPVIGATEKQLRELRGTRVGYVGQDPFAVFDPIRTVEHHVAEPFRAHGLPVDSAGIAGRLEALGIEGAAQRMRQRPHEWSGGMLQRATAAAATALEPDLVIADEPTSALDADLAGGVLADLRERARSLLIISHDLALVRRHADRILVMRAGEIVDSFDAAELVSADRHPYTRALSAAASLARVHRPAPRGDRKIVVRATRITKTYRAGALSTRAVAPTSLEVRAGEILGVCGPSGSGKSTLLRLLGGIESPNSGVVRFGGDGGSDAVSPETGAAARYARCLRKGYVMPVFQDPVASLDGHWPIWRSLTEPIILGQGRMSRERRRELAARMLAAVGLDGLDLGRRPEELSVGQCQRIAVQRALAAEPALLVADEPTASLDVVSAGVIVDLLVRAAGSGVGIVVVSHDRPRLESFVDRILDWRASGPGTGDRGQMAEAGGRRDHDRTGE